MQDPLLYAALGLVDLLAVDHALGDEDEVARPALDALAAAGAELQPEAPLGLEHIGVVARVDMPAGPGAGVGSGSAGPDVVVGERLATIHPGGLGSRAVQRIRSDQDGSVHGGLPSDRECPAAYVGRPWGTRSQRFSGKAAWSELTAAAHLILMGGCDPCAAGGTLLRQESCAKGDAVWLPGAAGRHLRLSSSCRGGTIPMTDVLPQQEPVPSIIPARLDRLGWSPFHTRMVAGLGGEGEPGQGDRPAG